MISGLLCLVVTCIPIIALLLIHRFRHSPSPSTDDWSHQQILRGLAKDKSRHETATALHRLIEEDGAGSWPPRANHDNWPSALRPYKGIYLELVPLLPQAEVSLDDAVNEEKRSTYRGLMRKLLAERIDMNEVEQILALVEDGDWDALPRDMYNGFYCCIAVCRHAYRWAMIPVVKSAQLEKVVDFPPELDMPWPYLQRSFGVTAESGNNTANVVHNFNERGERVYKINVGMCDRITSSEEAFFRMFYDLEVRALPIYNSIIRAIMAFDEGDKKSCLQHLASLTGQLRFLLTVFYDQLTEARVSRTVWLSYIQGFQGWGVGRYVDGKFTKYDGLSGNHVLVFQAVDAFLGMDRYLPDENMTLYIPRNQRELCTALKRHSFRNRIDAEADCEIEEEMQKIVKHLKVFRAAHRTRVMPYLKQPAPERLPMTAGKSVLVGTTTEEVLKPLDDMLVNRLNDTVKAGVPRPSSCH